MNNESNNELNIGLAILAAAVEFTICLSSANDISLLSAVLWSIGLGVFIFLVLKMYDLFFRKTAAPTHKDTT